MISSIIAIAVILIIVFLVYYYILAPIYLESYMKKKYGNQVRTYYYPVLGELKLLLKSIEVYKDPLGIFKFQQNKQPEVKFTVSTSRANSPYITFYDQDMIQQFLVDKIDNYEKRQTLMFDQLIGNPGHGMGIFSVSGDKWKNVRNSVSESFHYQKIKDRISLILKITQQTLSHYQTETDIPVVKLAETITGKVISQSFFGENFDEEWRVRQNFELELKQVINLLATHPKSSAWYMFRKQIFGEHFYKNFPFLLTSKEKSIRKRLFRINNYCDKHIKNFIKNTNLEELQKKEDKIFLEVLIQKQLEGKIQSEQILNNFIGFFVAGQDTTAVLTGMCLYALANNQVIQKKMFKEVDAFYSKNKKIEQSSDLDMPYMSNFIKECLRLYSPAPGVFVRKATKDHKIGDFEMKKGWNANVALWWGPQNNENFVNPLQIYPERWDSEQLKKLHPYSYTPFSAGKRNCIGQHLAILECKVILMEILKIYQIIPVSGKQLEYGGSFLYQPKDDSLVQFQTRF